MSRSQYRIAIVAIVCFIMAGPTLAFQKKEAISTKLVSLSFINVELRQIFQSMEKQTGIAFFYSNNLLNVNEKRTIKVNSVSVEQALSLLLDSKKYSWRLDESGKFIKISSRENPISSRAAITETQDTLTPSILTGRVTDSKGEPLPGATIKLKGSAIGTTSDASGIFKLLNLSKPAIIQVSFTGYYNREIPIEGTSELQIALSINPNELKEIEVVSTGYQKIPKERATGSFVSVDNKLINRSVSTDILSRLNGVASGVSFNKPDNKVGGDPNTGGDPQISIRGRSTIFANTQPLIVLDNFPYEGDPTNINPNDIESITILKDAAAASIWGVRAGNGVIVLTSKKGKNNQKPLISLNSNITVSDKPDIYSIPQMTSAEYVGYEKYLFTNGNYDPFLNLPFLAFFPQSPVVDILDKESKGIISHPDAANQLAVLSATDYRKDYMKYFLKQAVNQQYALSVTGGNANDQYYISGGFDKNLASQVPNDYNRFTMNAHNSFKFYNQHLELTTDVLFTKSKAESNPTNYITQYPYEQLVDKNGNALPVIRDFRQASKDALSNLGLLDWNYYPYGERLNRGNQINLTDYRINIGLNYKIFKDILSAGVNYQYQQGNIDQSILSDESTYATRLMINQYAEIDSSGSITYPVPLGATLNKTNTNYTTNTGRAQLNYHQFFGRDHEIIALGGFEIKDYSGFTMTNYLYGYNTANATNVPVDYFTTFTKLIGGSSDRIPNIYGQSGTTDRFVSYYANAAYTFKNRYIFSASARRDESNLFGVDANQKGVPLYSFGLSWDISKEKFYQVKFLPYLRLRITDGYNGNLSKTLSAYTTAKTDKTSRYNLPQQAVINPPNPKLSWEKVNIINAALDFAIINRILSGSIELYQKRSDDLIGNSAISPQTGVVQFTGNTANMVTKGIDITLNTINLKRKLSWTTNFLFSYVKDKITKYNLQTGTNSYYISQNYLNPVVGRPYSALFAFPYAGLDSAGNPQGYLNGKISKDYGQILNSTNLSDLKYMGTRTPTIYGGLRNNFGFHNIELSFNITYKMGYYFKRGSFTSSSFSFQQADYAKRWQNPGDEKHTNVPALIYPNDNQRDELFANSEALVEKGDHIRLQDIQVSYSFPSHNHKSPFSNLKIYGYVNNIGILWRANKLGLDPDYVGNGYYSIPAPRSYSLGVNASF